jgi:hypothetical protein
MSGSDAIVTISQNVSPKKDIHNYQAATRLIGEADHREWDYTNNEPCTDECNEEDEDHCVVGTHYSPKTYKPFKSIENVAKALVINKETFQRD